MEVTECTKLVLNRIQNLEPENATKIIGYLLLKHTHQEIVEFAFGPDNLIISLINEAKSYLTSSPKPNNSRPMELLADHPLHHMSVPATISRPFSSHSSFCVPAPYWEPGLSSDQQSLVQNLDFPPPAYTDLVRGLHKQADFMGSEEHSHPLDPLGPDFSSNYCYQEAVLNGELGSRNSLRSPPSLPEFPMKACHYFHKGYCRHGINCRFSHGQIIPDGFSQIYNPNYNELGNEDNAFPPGSLEKLEMEITELLRSRGGMPVSIASLPILYLEKYGKVLQAEGYLTESQRHGKAGFSLTKLLARLKNSIQLIDRPHGQHSVVLAEDAPKFMDYRNERSEQEAVLASSHQIYLTFPAESTFSEEDVLNYFKQYGPVRDVRIPRQEKRMFGFVSFLYPETVRLILSRGHPHYICGARVLVKPYKEKSKLIDRMCFCMALISELSKHFPQKRRYNEKVELPMYYPSQYFESDPDLNAIPRICDSSRLLKKQLIDEHEHALELLRRRLFDMQLTCKQMAPQPYIGFMTEELKVPEVRPINPPVAVNNGTMPDGIARETSNDHGYQDCSHIELPDSPFASPRLANSVPAAI